MTTGQIILLNGPSSAGKSTLAETLQQVLAAPYLYLSIDKYLDLFTDYISAYQKMDQSLYPSRGAAAKFPPENIRSQGLGLALTVQIIGGFHQSIAAKAQAGERVIADHVLEQRRWLEECVKLFAGIEVIFVGVHCSLEELERREIKRGDRDIGLARHQSRRVHAHSIYDIEVDTTNTPPETCAATIVAYLESDETPSAFDRLRKEMDDDR